MHKNTKLGFRILNGVCILNRKPVIQNSKFEFTLVQRQLDIIIARRNKTANKLVHCYIVHTFNFYNRRRTPTQFCNVVCYSIGQITISDFGFVV